MSSGDKCRECGTAISADSPGGFCAQCLLGLGLAKDQESATDTLTEKPGDRIGRYRLLQEIGHGGCGVVYMAEQEEPVRRKVALKVIKLGMDTRQVVARFEAERQALALMDHPNIAKVLDAGSTERPLTRPADTLSPVGGEGRSEGSVGNPRPSDGRGAGGEGNAARYSSLVTSAGRPYFVMELVGGIKITDYCDNNHLTIRQRLDLFIQVCRAIQHAHQKGIIHRDIKPSNVLVTNQDGTAVPKVIDFGIAKATQGRLTDQTLFTAFEQFIGTPAYMSPEQAQLGGLDIDTRSDIYSLGVLLYELLTGKTPFDAKEMMAAGIDAMRRTIQEKEPPKPSTRLTQDLVAAEKVGRVTPCPPPTQPVSPEDGAHGVTRPTPKSEAEVSADSRWRLQLKEQIHLVRGDLDWIAMKCLEKDRARRYETANGLAMDLERNLRNEPVVARPPTKAYRVRKFIRRNKVLATSIAAISAVLVMGITGVLWEWRRAVVAQRGEASARQRSENAERQMRESLRDAYLAQAQALRTSDQPGRRFRSLEAIAKAKAIRPAMDLRNEAIACLTVPGLRPLKQWAKGPLWSIFWFDASYQRYGTNDALGNVTIRDTETDTVQFQLPTQGAPLTASLASPDDRFLATADQAGHAYLWTLSTPTPRPLPFPTGATLLAFTPDSHALVVQHADDSLHFLNTTNGADEKSFPGPAKADVFRFDSSGEKFLARTEGRVVIRSASDGRHLRTFLPPDNKSDSVFLAAWHPDGRRVAVSSVAGIGIWDIETGLQLAALEGNEGPLVGLAFTETGEYLASASWDHTTRLWHTDTHREVLRLSDAGNHLRLSSGNRRLSFQAWYHTQMQLFELVLPSAVQRFSLPPTASRPAHWSAQALFSPDGELVVVPDNEGVFLFQPPHSAPLALVPAPDTYTACLTPDGGAIFTGGADGVRRWPIAWSADRAELRLGPPEVLEPTRGLAVNMFDVSRNGQWLVAATKKDFLAFRLERPAEIVGSDGTVQRGSRPHLSPDGRLAASLAAPSHYQVQVWDPRTGALITNLPVYQVSDTAFSPDGRWLACAAVDATTFWETTGWRLRHRIPHSPEEPGRPHVAFSPDGQVAAVIPSHREIRLVSVETGEELATLPIGRLINCLRFNPTGDHLAVANEPGYFHLWNLRLIRQQLATMNLDWEMPPYAPEAPALTKRPLRVVILTNAPVTTPPR